MFSTGAPWVRQLAARLTVASAGGCVSQIPVCAVVGSLHRLSAPSGRKARGFVLGRGGEGRRWLAAGIGEHGGAGSPLGVRVALSRLNRLEGQADRFSGGPRRVDCCS